MSCERTLPLLPLVALDSADAADRTAALEHVAGCARCAAALRELEAARAALSSFSVDAAPATDAAAIRADDADVPADRRRTAPRRLSRIATAAAAALVAALALGFALLHGDLTIERGGATLHIAWRAPTGDRSQDAIAPDIAAATTPEYLASALDELARHVDELEARHQRDLLLLADTVDRSQRTRDRGVEQRMHSLEQKTRDGFLYTNQVLDHVVDRLAQDGAPAPSAPTDH